MAHFAKLNTQNKVVDVVVINNDTATDEAKGIAFLESLYGQEDGITWKQTSYNTKGKMYILVVAHLFVRTMHILVAFIIQMMMRFITHSLIPVGR